MGSQGHAHAEELRLMVNGVASGSFVREAIEKDKSLTPKAHLEPLALLPLPPRARIYRSAPSCPVYAMLGRTQDLSHARQALYQLSHTPAPIHFLEAYGAGFQVSHQAGH